MTSDPITNVDRASWARSAVEAYAAARDVPFEDVPLDDQC